MNKKIVFPVIALTLLGGSYFAVTAASAQTSPSPMSGLSQAIAQKFNLNQTEVQDVVDTWHTQKHDEMKKNMQQRLTEKLDQAVTDGKLTESQKQALLTKLSEEMGSFDKENFKKMTPEQRKTEIEKKRTELETWATSQGIDLNALPQFFMGHKVVIRGMGEGKFNSIN